MKKLLLALALGTSISGIALAQQPVLPYYQTDDTSSGVIVHRFVPVTPGTPMPTSTSISGGFTAASVGTPIGVTNVSGAGTLPAGTVVVATNVGTTNGAYCVPGAGPATTSNQFLSPNGGWFAFQVGVATQLSCITSTGTTTVNLVGGAGLPAGTGGGGGSSSAFGTTFPSSGIAAGFEYLSAQPSYTSGQMVPGTTTQQGAQVMDVQTTNNQLHSDLIGPPNVLGQTTDQTAVTQGSNVPWEGSLNGKGVVLPYALPGQIQDPAPAGQTGTTPITVLAASGSASLSEYMTSIQIGRSDAGTTAITAAVTDATLTFTFVVPNSGGGGGNNITFPVALKFAANHAVTCTASSGVTTFYCFAQGYNAP